MFEIFKFGIQPVLFIFLADYICKVYIETICGLSTAISYNGTGDKKCFDMYAEYMECADPTGCVGSIAWDYQVSNNSMFSIQ